MILLDNLKQQCIEKNMTYKVKPQIRGPRSLYKFLSAIPAKFWCVDIRENHLGQRCVLGHLDAAYGYGAGRDGFDEYKLAAINNGALDGIYINDRPEGTSVKGKDIKARVLRFIKSRF